MDTVLKTSEEWMKLYKDEFIVYDPDGWDRSNFDFSWFIEKISYTEFQQRVMRSTLIYRK